ncbi:MAG: hypothetical protein HRU07_00160 [Nitrosopumilus sp.]|nr:hypothetical protein [Nitrosopumilus sp.]NRA04594.1 hypothetical protein [Nitrosopumilus sp.]
MSTEFDPDELQLEKKDIIRIVEVVQKRWRKGGFKNKLYLMGIAAFKQGIEWTPDEILKFVWRDMVSLTNKMIEYNARKRMMGEMPKTAEMLKLLEDEIEYGNFAGEPID